MMGGANNAMRRVSVMRFKACLNPCDADDRLRHLPAGFTGYVLVSVYRSLV